MGGAIYNLHVQTKMFWNWTRFEFADGTYVKHEFDVYVTYIWECLVAIPFANGWNLPWKVYNLENMQGPQTALGQRGELWPKPWCQTRPEMQRDV